MRKLPLSNLEEKTWHFILGYMSDNDYAPTYREIADGIGYKGNYPKQHARYILKNMQLKGYVDLQGGQRAIKIVNHGKEKNSNSS